MDDFKAFDRVIHRLLCLNLSRHLDRAMLGWSESYFTGRVQRVKLDDFLSETVSCTQVYHREATLNLCSSSTM
jgi:hypothetical protein